MRVLQEVHQGQLVCRHWVDAGGVHAGFLNSLLLAPRNQIRPENSWRQLIVQENAQKQWFNTPQKMAEIALEIVAFAKRFVVACNGLSTIIACLTAVLNFVDEIRRS